MRTNGLVDHTKTLSIPDTDRIPELVKENRRNVLTVITAAVGGALSNLNLRVGMNEDQIVELADAIIDTAHEDQLSIEDVLLFLRDLITGKMGKIYDRMDMPTFFEMFENYRQARYEKLKAIKYEQQAQFKTYGPQERGIDDLAAERESMRGAITEHMRTLYKEDKPNDQS